MHVPDGVFLLLLIAIAAAIAILDLRTMRIPDPLTAALALTGVIYATDSGLPALGLRLLAAAVTVGLLVALRHAHARATGRIGLGLGDVKLLGAAALWVPPDMMPVIVLVASLAGLFCVGALRLASGAWAADRRLPFGPFIAAALVLVFVSSLFGDMA